jgi:hypothetical protein
MIKKWLICIAASFASTAVMAQLNEGTSYTTALGLKMLPGAVTLKHFVKENRALEGLGYFHQDGFRITGLYEIHGDIGNAPGLKWYIGGGAHVGFWNESWRNANRDKPSGAVLGVSGVLGLDWKIKGAPINMSLDWQPSINVVGYNYFEGGWGGLAVRYTF